MPNDRDNLPKLIALVVLGILIVALLLAGCAYEPPVDEPIYPPPASYRVWWAEVEACTHRHGNFDKVHWFEADLVSGGRLGYRLGNDVWLDHAWKDDRRAVAHEEFHVLGGSGDHHEPEWKICNL